MRFALQKYEGPHSRHICPECKKPNQFVRYIDTDTGIEVESTVGKCNRETKCGYHYTPKQFFAGRNLEIPPKLNSKKSTILKPSFTEIPKPILNRSLSNYNRNNFVCYLKSVFGEELTNNVIRKYLIGTSKKWTGSTVFWQIDIYGRIRTGKVMLYGLSDGKRVKGERAYITWVHKLINVQGFNRGQCLFGEHLLSTQLNANISIVESEKTAIIGSICFPDIIWLAVGSLEGLTLDKCSVLKGRKVILFPDLDAFPVWTIKAKALQKGIKGSTFIVSDLLERRASTEDRENGLDIADYLLRHFADQRPD